ncbi:hypothetical protein GCM10010442_42240 [Kitasatospora kifunensis]
MVLPASGLPVVAVAVAVAVEDGLGLADGAVALGEAGRAEEGSEAGAEAGAAPALALASVPQPDRASRVSRPSGAASRGESEVRVVRFTERQILSQVGAVRP